MINYQGAKYLLSNECDYMTHGYIIQEQLICNPVVLYCIYLHVKCIVQLSVSRSQPNGEIRV